MTETLVETAYIYALPILMSFKTMFFYAVDVDGPQFKAPFNELENTARVYGPKDTAVVSPNSDTPYSLLWLDLRVEPVVLCVPEVDSDRYFSIMLQDLSTNLLPYIGSRATGNDAGCHMVAGPAWGGPTPEGVAQVIRADTDFVFVVYRTQLFDADDLPNVERVQAGYRVQALSAFAGTAPPPAPPVIEFPKWDETRATGNDFISYLNFCLQFIEPDAQEKQLWDELADIGVGAGSSFDYEALSAERQKAITDGVNAARSKIREKMQSVALAGHTRADYDHDWLLRAAITQLGWGANDAREASYPTYQTDGDGDALDASKHNYTLTFPSGGLPPVHAFWSLTMYDGHTQLMIENPLDRYLINSPMLPSLQTNADGSLTLYIQRDSPGKDKESNWLPAPDGELYILLRLYWPSQDILDGAWRQPEVRKGGDQ